jgi:hypothetical protein
MALTVPRPDRSGGLTRHFVDVRFPFPGGRRGERLLTLPDCLSGHGAQRSITSVNGGDGVLGEATQPAFHNDSRFDAITRQAGDGDGKGALGARTNSRNERPPPSTDGPETGDGKTADCPTRQSGTR